MLIVGLVLVMRFMLVVGLVLAVRFMLHRWLVLVMRLMHYNMVLVMSIRVLMNNNVFFFLAAFFLVMTFFVAAFFFVATISRVDGSSFIRERPLIVITFRITTIMFGVRNREMSMGASLVTGFVLHVTPSVEILFPAGFLILPFRALTAIIL